MSGALSLAQSWIKSKKTQNSDELEKWKDKFSVIVLSECTELNARLLNNTDDLDHEHVTL